MSEKDLDGAYSVKEFSERFGIGITKTYQEIALGRLRARRCNNRTLIGRKDALEWFENLPQKQKRAA